MQNENAIEVQGLTRKFGNLTAVDNLYLQVKKSSIYGFLGPNGCGKSTTIRMLCGLLKPTEGAIRVLDYDIPREAEALKLRVGYMTQKFSLYEDLSVKENLEFLGTIYGMQPGKIKSRISELLAIYSLDQLKRQRVGSMSGGQKQRLALAAATIHQPALLFLDEPTSAVDPENRRDFWEKLFDLCDQGTTILVSTHYMDEAERCHELAVMEAGQLRAAGAPLQLMDDMGAHVVEIKADNLRSIKSSLLLKEGIRSAAQQGIRLRVLVDNTISEPVSWLKKLVGEGAEYALVSPSLEDVFVTVTGRGRQ